MTKSTRLGLPPSAASPAWIAASSPRDVHMIGIMQGRLLPPVGGRIQAFPGDGWQREFALAAALGYDAIELTIETASLETHPVMSARGRDELAALSAGHGVALAGLCCDVFMETPFAQPGRSRLRGSNCQDRRVIFDAPAAYDKCCPRNRNLSVSSGPESNVPKSRGTVKCPRVCVKEECETCYVRFVGRCWR